MTTSSLLLSHYLTNKDRTASMVSFWRSFAELSNGHGFCYVFLIGCFWIFKKHFVLFFATVRSQRGDKDQRQGEKPLATQFYTPPTRLYWPNIWVFFNYLHSSSCSVLSDLSFGIQKPSHVTIIHWKFDFLPSRVGVKKVLYFTLWSIDVNVFVLCFGSRLIFRCILASLYAVHAVYIFDGIYRPHCCL